MSTVSEAEVIQGTGDRPVTRPQLVAELLRLGVRPGMTVLTHSSLSSLGWVVGGAPTVLYALEDAVGPAGTLMMPAFCEGAPEPSLWHHPPVPESWWEEIRHSTPPFDPDGTPTHGLGQIAELFRTQPGTVRSRHPNLSFCARGPEAHHLLHNHRYDFGLGVRSPLDRLYDLDGKVLLMGVDHGSNSSIHLAEFRSNWKGRDRVVMMEGRVLQHGRPVRVRFRELDWNSDDFSALGEDFERETGQVARGPLGRGEGRLMDQRALVDYAFEWLPRHRGAGEAPRPATEGVEARRAPHYLLRPPAAAFEDEGKWHKTRRQHQASRTRRK